MFAKIGDLTSSIISSEKNLHLTSSQNHHKICAKSVHNQNLGKIREARKFEPYKLSLIHKISKP